MCLVKGTVELDCISDSVGHTCSQLEGRAVHISSISAKHAQMASSFLVALFFLLCLCLTTFPSEENGLLY